MNEELEEIAPEPSEVEEPEVKPEPKKAIDKEIWTEIRSLYEHDKAGVTELSSRFGISKQAISKHFRKNGVVRGSALKQAAERGAARSAEAEEFAKTKATQIVRVKLSQFKANAVLAQETMKLIQDAKTAGVPISTKTADFKALNQAAEVLRKTREAMLHVLDAENTVDESELPVFEIEYLTKEKIEQLRASTAEDELALAGEDEVEPDEDDVVIEGDEDDEE